MFGFINKGSDELTSEFIEKSHKDRSKLVPQYTTNKNGFQQLVYVNPNKDNTQPQKPDTKKKDKKKEKKPEDYSDCVFDRAYDPNSEWHQNLNRVFLHKTTSLGTPINEVSYTHLFDHVAERNTTDMNIIRAARTIMSTSPYHKDGTNKEGSTEYWGEYTRSDGTTDGMIVVVKDRHNITGDKKHPSCLLTIIVDLSDEKLKRLARARLTGILKSMRPFMEENMMNNPVVLEAKYEDFLKRTFGMTFQGIMDLPNFSKEKIEIEDKLWYILENDVEFPEDSILATSIVTNWGRYDRGRDILYRA